MDEQHIPIDINTNKLLDWLISRRHVNKEWQEMVIKIREKINNAIQDMPAHEGIIKLLSGQHINYFHCVKIVDILKETEADTKNLFGQYGSQRMKDWQEIVGAYQKDNLYLAEAAQILMRNVNYEVPSLKKQQAKLEQNQLDCEKKIKDCGKIEATALNEFSNSCKQLGIAGVDIKKELVDLLNDLPKTYEKIAKKLKTVKPAVEFYLEFVKFLSGKEELPINLCVLLTHVVKNGNTTVYEFIYGEKPIEVELPRLTVIEEEPPKASDEIDFGDDNFDASVIDFGDTVVETGEIDWGTNGSSSDEGFEMVSHTDVNEGDLGIVVEKSGMDGGVARGEEALSVMDSPKTHHQLIDELMEIASFLKIRLSEMSTESNDLLSLSQMQDAPTILQMQTPETVACMLGAVQAILQDLTGKRVQHLHNIKHSPKYVDILTGSLTQKLDVAGRMRANKEALEAKIVELRAENEKIEPTVRSIVDSTKLLQRQIEEDLMKKYKGRVVNIVGGVNML